MTPKEKALELFNKFNNPDTTNYPYVHNAQQCALIAVDEIIEVARDAYDEEVVAAVIIYWSKVKQEIEQL
jgi:hypothetical protein